MMAMKDNDLYDELLLTIVKAMGNKPKRGYLRSLNTIHDKNEIRVYLILKKIINKARLRFLKRFKLANLPALSMKVKAEHANSIEAELRKIMADAFSGASPELTSVLEQHISDIANNFSSVYDVDINYNLVNDDAVKYLRAQTDNYFSTLSDNAAQGIDNSIADAMANPDGYDIPSIVDNIRSTWGKDTISFPTSTLNVDDWATLTARTETARAASISTKATLDSLNLTKWQWNCNDEPCDICEHNNEQIVNVGDDFDSGDMQPPSHPNCRCIVIPLQEELDSTKDDQDTEETAPA